MRSLHFHRAGLAGVALQAHARRNPLRMGVPRRRKIRHHAFAASGRRRGGAEKFRGLQRRVRHAPVVERRVEAVVRIRTPAEIQVAIAAEGKSPALVLANRCLRSINFVVAIDVEPPDILSFLHLVRQREVVPRIDQRCLKGRRKRRRANRIVIAVGVAVVRRNRQMKLARTVGAAPAQDPSAVLCGRSVSPLQNDHPRCSLGRRNLHPAFHGELVGVRNQIAEVARCLHRVSSAAARDGGAAVQRRISHSAGIGIGRQGPIRTDVGRTIHQRNAVGGTDGIGAGKRPGIRVEFHRPEGDGRCRGGAGRQQGDERRAGGRDGAGECGRAAKRGKTLDRHGDSFSGLFSMGGGEELPTTTDNTTSPDGH